MKRLFKVVCVVVLVWFVACVVDVNLHNDVNSADFEQYAEWNVIPKMFPLD